MRLSSIRTLPTLHGCLILQDRFWGKHAAKYQGQFTRLDCQDHHRCHRRVDGVDRFRCHFSSHVDNSQDAAKVNGEEISQNELSQAVDMQRRQLMQQLGKDFDASLAG
jgi:hypothetical protein